MIDRFHPGARFIDFADGGVDKGASLTARDARLGRLLEIFKTCHSGDYVEFNKF